MRAITAAVGLMVLAGCTSLQRPAPVRRAAVSAATCDSAASVAMERAHLAGVANTLGEISTGASANAYSTSAPRVATPGTPVASPSASGARATSSMIANASNARVEVWSGEARKDLTEYQAVVGQIAALDAAARTLPTTKSCRAAGFASFTSSAS